MSDFPKIVIVDDDDVIRTLIVSVVQETCPGAQAVDYFSSLQALQEIASGSVALLITNCHMPDMDGPTLIRKVREHKHAMPIIMVSGSDEARELGENAGVDRFVPKTQIHTALAEAIHALLADPVKAVSP